MSVTNAELLRSYAVEVEDWPFGEEWEAELAFLYRQELSERDLNDEERLKLAELDRKVAAITVPPDDESHYDHQAILDLIKK